jgi:hypothetical protein
MASACRKGLICIELYLVQKRGEVIQSLTSFSREGMEILQVRELIHPKREFGDGIKLGHVRMI